MNLLIIILLIMVIATVTGHRWPYKLGKATAKVFFELYHGFTEGKEEVKNNKEG